MREILPGQTPVFLVRQFDSVNMHGEDKQTPNPQSVM